MQDVHAPPEVVWGRILDFPAYTRMVPRVTLCENYKVQDKFLEVRNADSDGCLWICWVVWWESVCP